MEAGWEDTCQRFHIGKRYHNAHLNEVKKLYLWAYEEGMHWLSQKLKPSLYLSGNAGSGKTYMALALLRGVIDQHVHKADIRYITSDDLDDTLLQAIENKNELYIIENFCEVPYLFIDDLGVEKQTERVIKQYYKIIDRRLNDYKTTVFTSNISKTKIEKNLGDRIASRLELCNEIKFPDRDLRKEI
jgi:DNA replication protein DnaC